MRARTSLLRARSFLKHLLVFPSGNAVSARTKKEPCCWSYQINHMVGKIIFDLPPVHVYQYNHIYIQVLLLFCVPLSACDHRNTSLSLSIVINIYMFYVIFAPKILKVKMHNSVQILLKVHAHTSN